MINTTLNEFVATIFALRALFKSWIIPPLITVCCPILLELVFRILNLVSNGFALPLIFGSMLLTLGGRYIIMKYSPSASHREDALNKSFPINLPLCSLLVSYTLLRFIIIPLSTTLGVESVFKSQLHIPSYILFLKIAFTMMILGLIIVLRYLGPVSVMRCSAYPLASKPLVTKLRYLFAPYASKEILKNLILTPINNPEIPVDTKLQMNKNTTYRRYDGPTLQKSLSLLIVSGFLAWTAALIFSYGQPENEEYISFVLSVILHVLLTCLDGKSHELNPRRYEQITWRSLTDIPQIRANLKGTFFSFAFVPILAVSYSFDLSIGNLQRLKMFFFSILITTLSTVYMSLVDILCHASMFKSHFNLQQLIVEATSEKSPNMSMEVAIQSLLMGDSELIDSILKPVSKHRTVDLEDEELTRNEEVTKKIAAVLEAKKGDLDLAEDLLRVLILESLGGSDTLSSNLELSKQHMQLVKLYVKANPNMAIPGQPWSIPLVRALCAYSGGLAMKLKKLSETPKSKHGTNSTFESWTIPSGAIQCSKWALVAATRCVVISITATETASYDWRASPLSVFVPTLLVTAFQLRSGIQKFQKKFPSKIDSDLHSVMNTCNECAIFLLKKIKSLEGIRTVEVNIPCTECREWIETLPVGESTPGSPSLRVLENNRPLALYNSPAFAIRYY